MKKPEFFDENLETLLETSLITSPEKNLRSKIDSLIRSIENLTAKKLRLEYEITTQKKSLARKRMELKKATKHLKVNLESAVNSALLSEAVQSSDPANEVDNYLLQESFRILDQD